MSYQGRYSQKKKSQKPKGGKGLKIFLAVLGVLMSAVVVFGAVGFFYFRSKLKLITQVQYSDPIVDDTDMRYGYFDDEDETWATESAVNNTTAASEPLVTEPDQNISPEKDYGKTGKIINVMLIGQDSREGEDSKLADSLILGSINKETKTLTLISFLRDTFLKMPDYKGHECGKNRINVNYALGYKWAGEKGAMEMLDLCIQNNFGVEIDGNVEINFLDFATLVNYMGGVSLTLDEDEANYLNQFRDYEGHFKPGMNDLDGLATLYYVRMRHSSNSDSDFKRTERQRKVLTELVKIVATMSLSEVNEMVDDLLPLIRTDIEPSRIMDYVLEVAPLLPSLKIETQQIPAEGTAHGEIKDIYNDGMESSVLVPDVQANKRILMKICEDVEIP